MGRPTTNKIRKRCANKSCRKSVYCTEKKILKFELQKRRFYCGKKCERKFQNAGRPKTWIHSRVKYLIENVGIKTIEEVCKHLKCSKQVVLQKLTHLRKKDKTIGFFKKKEVGDIRERTMSGIVYRQQKQEDGRWVSLGRKTPKIPKVKKEKIVKERKHARTMRTPPKPPLKRMETREIDYSSLRHVKVNKSTTVLADKNKTDAEVIEEWNKKHRS